MIFQPVGYEKKKILIRCSDYTEFCRLIHYNFFIILFLLCFPVPPGIVTLIIATNKL